MTPISNSVKKARTGTLEKTEVILFQKFPIKKRGPLFGTFYAQSCSGIFWPHFVEIIFETNGIKCFKYNLLFSIHVFKTFILSLTIIPSKAVIYW